ncbi:MAG: hypothetical protein Q9220_002055 [cf. Caloplaca sp. 1 TL-2023]
MEHPSKSPYKSFRKKYLKMRHGFKDKIRESNALFEDQESTVRIANHLQEQNDQLLDLLYTLNSSFRVPAPLRYTLSPTPSPSAVPGLESDLTLPAPSSRPTAHSALAALEEAHQEFSRGEMSPARYREISSQLAPFLENPTPLTSLFGQIPHTTLESTMITTNPTTEDHNKLPTDFAPSSSPLNYLSPSHEDDYLSQIDTALASPHPDIALAALKKEHLLSVKDTAKDLLLRNPGSAYNWLRKHRPALFAGGLKPSELGLDESGSGSHQMERMMTKMKPSPKPNTSHPAATAPGGGGVAASGTTKSGNGHGGKREKASGSGVVHASSSSSKPEPEMLDDEGNLIGGMGLDGAGAGPAAGKGGKRKRGEDDAYRPKGGSSRPGKRKRAGTGTGKSGRVSGVSAGGGGGSGGGAMEEE